MSDNPYRPPNAAAAPEQAPVTMDELTLAVTTASGVLPWVRLAAFLSLASAVIAVARGSLMASLPDDVRAGVLRGLASSVVVSVIVALVFGNYARQLARLTQERSPEAMLGTARAHNAVFRGYGLAVLVSFVVAMLGTLLLLRDG